MYHSEKILPYSKNITSKSAQVEKMFDDISLQYDLLNHALSFGIDKMWRRRGITALKNLCLRNILDIATGTGDLALQAYRMLKPDEILGIDISEKMMEIGRKKVAAAGLTEKIHFEKQDCVALSLADKSFDAAMAAFGVRNFENLDKALQEIRRVLRIGGRLVILELSTPDTFPMRQFYKLYSRLIPAVGRLVSKNEIAYQYLPKSISAFPQFAEMVKILEKNGFTNVRFKKLTFGICALYVAEKMDI